MGNIVQEAGEKDVFCSKEGVTVDARRSRLVDSWQREVAICYARERKWGNYDGGKFP